MHACTDELQTDDSAPADGEKLISAECFNALGAVNGWGGGVNHNPASLSQSALPVAASYTLAHPLQPHPSTAAFLKRHLCNLHTATATAPQPPSSHIPVASTQSHPCSCERVSTHKSFVHDRIGGSPCRIGVPKTQIHRRQGCIGRGGRYPPSRAPRAQPIPSHCPPDAKCRRQRHF